MILLETLIPIRKTRRLPHLGPKATLTIEKKIDPLNEYWIRHAQEVLMTLPASGQLSLGDIQTEQSGSGQASLGSMSDIAGFTEPDQVADFYSYTFTTAAQWKQPVVTGQPTIASNSVEYRYDTGSWTTFSGTRVDSAVTATTLGYRFTIIYGSNGGSGEAKCGSTDGGSDYGSDSSPGSAFESVQYSLASVTTAGRSNMYFTGTATG